MKLIKLFNSNAIQHTANNHFLYLREQFPIIAVQHTLGYNSLYQRELFNSCNLLMHFFSLFS